MKATSMKRQILVALGMMIFTSAQGICASISYKIMGSGSSHECELFLAALKASRLAALSDDQLCEVVNSPITNLLSSPHIRDIEWQPYPIQSKSELHKLAQRINETGITGVARVSLPRFAKSVAQIMSSFDAINASSGIVVKKAALHIGGETFYAIEMKRKTCNSTYTWHEPLPIWGAFMNRNYMDDASVGYMAPGGTLFYMDGHLMDFYISPRIWNTDTNLSKAKDNLFIGLGRLMPWKDTHGHSFLDGQVVCGINIHKNM